MEEPGSQLHPAGFSHPEAPVSVTTLKDEKSDGADCPKYEDMKGFTGLNAPITIQTLKEDKSEETDCPQYEDITLGPLWNLNAQSPDHYQDGEFEPPPPYFQPPQPDFLPAPVQKPIPIPTSLISEDAARQALLEYATKKCCYSTGPARQMIFRDFQPFNTFRYRLDTFTETRICKWESDPHYGGEVDGPENGPAPNAWDVPVVPPCLFQKAEYCTPLPHTASVQICSDCGGLGRTRCILCYGIGRRTCMSCGGCGRSNNQMCFACGGMGRNTCLSCGGSGYLQCLTCCGQGEVVRYILLTVKWENHNFEFIADHKTDFKSKRFKKVTGELIFSDEQQMVTPVTSFPEPSVSESSQNAISQHRATLTNSKILQQRHSIEWLPLTKVTYTWHDAEYDYYVYGTENRAYAKNYPRKCCCAIM